MRKKIFKNIFISATVSAVFMSIAVMITQYYAFEKSIMDELSSDCDYIEQGINVTGDYHDYFDLFVAEDRITIISPDGTVLYDNSVDESAMENHVDREEVVQAFRNGSGSASRYSSTQNATIIYYAKLMDNGNVLRVSTTQQAVQSLVINVVAPMLLVLVFIVILSFFLSRYIARRIVAPINALDLDSPLDAPAYDELSPLLLRLEHQRREIAEKIRLLTEKQCEFNEVTENMREGLILLDKNKSIMTINKSAAKIFSADARECEGINILELDRSSAMQDCVQKALEGEAGSAILEHENRTYRIMASDVSLDSAIAGIVVLILDITDKELAERSRREFSANVSHELKTPLTSISGYAEIIRDGVAMPDDINRFAGRIYDEANRLIELINDIIKLSQLDEASVYFKKEPVDLLAVGQEAASRLSALAEKKNISISVSGEPAGIYGAPKVIDEMIFNLIDNAIKYNVQGGKVNIVTGWEDARAFVSVTDTGVGIPAEHHDAVFERFYRVDKSHSKETGGTGLGLSIVKHGAVLHHAEIRLDSEEGTGTSITLLF